MNLLDGSLRDEHGALLRRVAALEQELHEREHSQAPGGDGSPQYVRNERELAVCRLQKELHGATLRLQDVQGQLFEMRLDQAELSLNRCVDEHGFAQEQLGRARDTREQVDALRQQAEVNLAKVVRQRQADHAQRAEDLQRMEAVVDGAQQGARLEIEEVRQKMDSLRHLHADKELKLLAAHGEIGSLTNSHGNVQTGHNQVSYKLRLKEAQVDDLRGSLAAARADREGALRKLSEHRAAAADERERLQWKRDLLLGEVREVQLAQSDAQESHTDGERTRDVAEERVRGDFGVVAVHGRREAEALQREHDDLMQRAVHFDQVRKDVSWQLQDAGERRRRLELAVCSQGDRLRAELAEERAASQALARNDKQRQADLSKENARLQAQIRDLACQLTVDSQSTGLFGRVQALGGCAEGGYLPPVSEGVSAV